MQRTKRDTARRSGRWGKGGGRDGGRERVKKAEGEEAGEMFPEKNANEWGERSWLKMSDCLERMMGLTGPERRKPGGRMGESGLTRVGTVALQKEEGWRPQSWGPVVWGREESGSAASGAGGEVLG